MIDYFNLGFFTLTHSLGLYGLSTVKLQYPTLILGLVLTGAFGLGITAGYHRLWAHRTYEAHWTLRLFLYLLASGAMESKCKWWCLTHRAHHKFTDTERDPYNAKKGLFWSHIGWLLNRPSEENKEGLKLIEMKDLEEDPILQLDRFYFLISPVMSFLLPTLIAGYFWGDYRGGFFYAAMIRSMIVHHMTFCINSLAHWRAIGSQPYNRKFTPVDCPSVALLTMGEGYHNYHHAYPQDYRNGFKWYHFDPTKWFIYSTSLLGLSRNLKVSRY